MLIIFLTSFMNMNQREAQGINLFFFIPCALYSVIKYKKEKLIDSSLLKPFIICGLIGVGIGYGVINVIPGEFLRKIFGFFLITMGTRDLFSKK